MICQSCGAREAAILIQTLIQNQVKKLALCPNCASNLRPEHPLDALMQALEHLAARARAQPARCGTCRTSLSNFKETGRLGCPNCYEHFRTQVKDLLPRVHAGAYQHRGKTPGRR